MPAKLTIQDAIDVFNKRDFTLLETEYVNSETPMRYICKCGNESKMSLKNAKKGKSCALCGRKSASTTKTTSIEDVEKVFSDAGCILLSTSYKFGEKLKYLCKCGNEMETTLGKAKYSGTSCKYCRAIKAADARRKYSIDEVKEMFGQKGKILLAEVFTNSTIAMPYICKCGTKSTINLNNFLKGKDCWKCRNDKLSEILKDPNITDEERELRRSQRSYKQFRIGVFTRDDYTCQCCHIRGTELNAHHIRNFADNPGVRTDVSNGITLCKTCHYKFHHTYGYRNTNAYQLAEFIANYNATSTQEEAV